MFNIIALFNKIKPQQAMPVAVYIFIELFISFS